MIEHWKVMTCFKSILFALNGGKLNWFRDSKVLVATVGDQPGTPKRLIT